MGLLNAFFFCWSGDKHNLRQCGSAMPSFCWRRPWKGAVPKGTSKGSHLFLGWGGSHSQSERKAGRSMGFWLPLGKIAKYCWGFGTIPIQVSGPQSLPRFSFRFASQVTGYGSNTRGTGASSEQNTAYWDGVKLKFWTIGMRWDEYTHTCVQVYTYTCIYLSISQGWEKLTCPRASHTHTHSFLAWLTLKNAKGNPHPPVMRKQHLHLIVALKELSPPIGVFVEGTPFVLALKGRKGTPNPKTVRVFAGSISRGGGNHPHKPSGDP